MLLHSAAALSLLLLASTVHSIDLIVDDDSTSDCVVYSGRLTDWM